MLRSYAIGGTTALLLIGIAVSDAGVRWSAFFEDVRSLEESAALTLNAFNPSVPHTVHVENCLINITKVYRSPSQCSDPGKAKARHLVLDMREIATVEHYTSRTGGEMLRFLFEDEVSRKLQDVLETIVQLDWSRAIDPWEGDPAIDDLIEASINYRPLLELCGGAMVAQINSHLVHLEVLEDPGPIDFRSLQVLARECRPAS